LRFGCERLTLQQHVQHNVGIEKNPHHPYFLRRCSSIHLRTVSSSGGWSRALCDSQSARQRLSRCGCSGLVSHLAQNQVCQGNSVFFGPRLDLCDDRLNVVVVPHGTSPSADYSLSDRFSLP
jgi:hypothetical protein